MLSTLQSADQRRHDKPKPPADVANAPRLLYELQPGDESPWRWFREACWPSGGYVLYRTGYGDGRGNKMFVEMDELARYVCSDLTKWFGSLNPARRPCDPDEPPTEYREMDRLTVSRNASDLEVRREQGTGSRSEVINPFLEDPIVDHGLGGVQFWTAAWTLRAADDTVVGAITVGRPNARMLDDGSVLQIDRLAAHPVRPKGTNSRLLSAAIEWARNEGYERIVTYAGGTDRSNRGDCYAAVGFEPDGETVADGSGWKDHGDDRDDVHGGETWTRRRWSIDL